MDRRITIKQRRHRRNGPIGTVTREPTVRIPVGMTGSTDKTDVPETMESKDTVTLEQPIEVKDVHTQLQEAQHEIQRLKTSLQRATGDGVSITIPVPPINAAGLTADRYEEVKTFYSGIIVEMINTTYQELDRRNKKGYGCYTIDSDKKEIGITVSVTRDDTPTEEKKE